MSRQRIIPVLLIDRGRLIKTVRFAGSTYVGDPVNAIRIFNEKAADEIIVLDISATRLGVAPDEALVARLASECFMPLCYGGGIVDAAVAGRLFALGVEKIVINSGLRSGIIRQVVESYGSQSVAYSLDVRRDSDGRLRAFGRNGSIELGPALDCAREAVEQGAGEVVLHMIDREGASTGYDLDAIREAASALSVPLVACGGARGLDDFAAAFQAGASAAAAGSTFVFIGRLRAVLITYPTEEVRARVGL